MGDVNPKAAGARRKYVNSAGLCMDKRDKACRQHLVGEVANATWLQGIQLKLTMADLSLFHSSERVADSMRYNVRQL